MDKLKIDKNKIEDFLGKNFFDLMTDNSKTGLLLLGENIPNPEGGADDWIRNGTISSLEVIKVLSKLATILEIEAHAVVDGDTAVSQLLSILGIVLVQMARSGKLYMDKHNIELPSAKDIQRENIRKVLDSNMVSPETRNLLLADLGKLNNEIDPPTEKEKDDQIFDDNQTIFIPTGAPIH